MKRDMNLIRQLVFHIEAASDQLDSSTIKLPNYGQDEIGYHCELMKEAGLIHADKTTDLDARYSEMMIYRLTWAGHDFLDAAKDDNLWNKVTKRIKDKVTSMAFDGLVALLKSAGQHLVDQGSQWGSE